MAKTIATGYTDTAIAGNPAMTVTVGKINFAADHRVKEDDTTQVVTTNVTAPIDQPELFRFSQRIVPDVYAGAGIDASAFLPIRQGCATLVECRETWAETDSGDATYRKLIPVKCGITLTLPSYGNITADQALTLILRTVGACFETGTVTSARVGSLLRGVMRGADFK